MKHEWHDYVDTADGRYVSETEADAGVQLLRDALDKIALHCRPDGLAEWAARAKSYPLDTSRAALAKLDGGEG